jgi:tetratricopeptide (TPR) repeat protein
MPLIGWTEIATVRMAGGVRITADHHGGMTERTADDGWNVFLSCPPGDRDLNERLSDVLREHGLFPREPQPGADWRTEITDAPIVVLAISPEAWSSDRCRSEWSAALESSWDDNRKILFPILIDSAAPPPFLLGTRYWSASSLDDTDLVEAVLQLVTLVDEGREPANVSMVWNRAGELRADRAQGIAYSADGDLLAVATGDGHILLRDGATGRDRAILGDGRLDMRTVTFSPDGRLVAGAAADAIVLLWDTVSGAEVHRIQQPSGDRPTAVAFSPDGRSLATAGADGIARLWDFAGREIVSCVPALRRPLETIAFSPDGQFLVTGGHDREIRIWNTDNGDQVDTLKTGLRAVETMAFAQDGRTLVAGGPDGRMILWDVARRKPTASLRGHKGAVRAVSFSPDTRLLASAADDGRVRIWTIDETEPVADLPHRGRVTSIQFSPNGLYLAASAADTIALWVVPTALRRHRLAEVEAAAYALSPPPEQMTEQVGDLFRELARSQANPERHDAARWLTRVGVLLRAQGRWDAAYSRLVEAIDAIERSGGPDHPDLVTPWMNLGLVAAARLQWPRAVHCFDQAIRIQQLRFGREHPSLGRLLVALGEAERQRSELDRATELFQEARQLRARFLGADHPAVAAVVLDLATVEEERDHLYEAGVLLREAAEIQRRSLGPDHPAVALSLLRLGRLARRQGQRVQCRSFAVDCLEIIRLLEHSAGTLRVDDEVRRGVAELLTWVDAGEPMGELR